MFKIRDNAIAPRKALYENALKRLTDAHSAARNEGMAHLHGRMAAATEEFGHDPEALAVDHDQFGAFVGVLPTPAGDRILDEEFGSPEDAPHPFLRSAATRAQPEANQVYRRALRRELGI